MKKLLSLLVLLLLVGCQSSKPAEQAAESGKESGKKSKSWNCTIYGPRIIRCGKRRIR